MEIHSALIILASTMVSVIAVGVEIRAIAKHHTVTAVLSAFVIAGGQLIALRLIPQSSSWLDMSAYVVGNMIGIWLSFHIFHITKPEFEVPLPICEGRKTCPVKQVPCLKKAESCPVYLLFEEKELSLETDK